MSLDHLHITVPMTDTKAPMMDEPRTTNIQVDPPVQHNHHQELRQLPRDPEGERAVLQSIESNASKNTQLLRELSTTADAPGQLGNNEVQLDRLEKRLTEQGTQVQAAKSKAKSQLKLHKRHRNPWGRKIIYKLVNKKVDLAQRAQEAELAYHESLDTRRKAEDCLAGLKADKVTLEKTAKDLADLAKRHGAAHEEIDKLYSDIFDGPTPGFPDEDEQEAQHQHATVAHAARTDALKAVVKGLKTLPQIKVAIEHAMYEISSIALDTKSTLISLSYVGRRLQRLGHYIERGIELSDSAIKDIPQPWNPELLRAKLLLDSIFKDIIIAAKLPINVRLDAVQIETRISALLKDAKEAQIGYSNEMKNASRERRLAIRETARTLEDQRQGLVQIRQSLFELTVGFGAAAPAYHECCDRAEGFESDSNRQCINLVGPVVEQLPDIAPPPEYDQVTAAPTTTAS